tara:strand:+ start:905 stop:2218 length:1314 start_codon:yes stop_codon:yes gene_type:complete
MADKSRDPMRHNPGANPALAEPGWTPPGGSGLKASRSTPGALGDLERAYLDAKDAYDASWVEYKRWLDKPHPSQLGLEWDSPEFRAYHEGMNNAARAGTAARQRLNQARVNLKRGRALPQYLKGEGDFMADPSKIEEYLDAEEAERVARQRAVSFNENYEVFRETGGKMGLDPNDRFNQLNEARVFEEYERAGRRSRAASDALRAEPTKAIYGDARFGPDVDAARARRAASISIPELDLSDDLAPDPVPSRRPPGTRSRLGLKGEGGFMRGVAPSARSTAARGLSTAMGVAAAPFIDYALDPESRTPVQFARRQEEAITGMVPGLVSPSELPPPAVLPPDRLKAVEATHGMVGVAPDPETPNVTAQEVRTFIRNRVAKGKKLPKWAEGITSMEGGRLSIKPVNPRDEAHKERKKARQEAAKPQNPRMGGPKRKYGTY